MSGSEVVRLGACAWICEEHTLAVVAEGHLGLAETNGVLACGDAIELLKLGLVDALQEKKLVVLTRGVQQCA